MSIMDKFFSLGPKEPKQKAKFEYSLMWVLFLTFVGLFIMRLVTFIRYTDYYSLLWAVIMLVIVYFNFQGLKAMYNAKKLMSNLKITPTEQEESIDSMLDEFKHG